MKFDPIYIIYQIICMQCSYYVVMGTIWGLCHAFLDHPVSLDHFFSPNYIEFTTFSGWIDVICTFLSAVAG